MKIATYNIRVDTDYDQKWQWSYREDHVLALINYHDWDIFCLQELRPNQLQSFNRLNNYHSFSAERDGDGTGEGLAIYYRKERYELTDSGFFWLSSTPEIPSIHEGSAYKRICVWCTLQDKVTKKESLILNTHLDNISESARYEGMKIILTRMKEKIENYPTFLLGDFNAEKTESVHQLILSHNFRSTKTESEQPHYGPNGSFQNFVYTTPWRDLEEIDYIYTNHGMIKTSGTLTDSCDCRYPSDHFPLEATIEF